MIDKTAPLAVFAGVMILTFALTCVLNVRDTILNVQDNRGRTMHGTTEIFSPAPPAPEIEPDLRVSIILSPCFSMLPFACLVDCLRFAADVADYSRKIYCHWQVIAPDLTPVQASCGVDVIPEKTLQQAGSADYLIVIGGRLPRSLEVPDETLDFIRDERDKGCGVIGICTGSFVVAKAGLLRGRDCAVNDQHLNQMKMLFPDVKSTADVNFIEDRGIITCNGGTSALDLVFSLIESHCGKARAVKAQSGLVLDKRFLQHNVPDRSYRQLLTCGDWRIEQAVALMGRNFSKPLTITALANRLNTSVRALNRAFRNHANESPSEICRNMRLAQGHWLLVNTTRTITQVALECGFSDAPHFSRLFKNKYGEPPGCVRELHR